MMLVQLGKPPSARRRQIEADLGLLLATVIWGTTFVLVKEALQGLPPLTFLALRFSLGFVTLCLLFGKRLRGIGLAELRSGAVIGAFLFAGFALQTLGLRTSGAGIAAFITGLCVVLVPIVARIWLHERLSPGMLVGVAAATIGLALLSLRNDLGLATGDLLVLGCAVAFAVQIVAVGRYAPTVDPIVLTILQIGFVAMASGAAALAVEHPSLALAPDLLVNLLFLSVVATAFVFCVQNLAQRSTPATHAGLIFTMEPVFAAVFAYMWLGEQLGLRAAVGAALILAGMLIAERWSKSTRDRSSLPPTRS